MHLAQSGLDAHVHGGKVGVRRHDADDAAGRWVETRGNHAEDNVLAREDTGDSPLVLDQDRRGVVLLHLLGRLLDRRPDADRCWRQAVEHRLERRARHLGPQRLDVLDDLLRLAGAQLGLHTLERVVEPPGGGIGTLQLLHGVVEALCDVEHARDVLVLVHDGQVAEALADHQVERVGGAGVGPRAQRVLGHDLGDGHVVWLEPGGHHTEGKVLGCEDARNPVVIVGN
jgi:hypothetical protein